MSNAYPSIEDIDFGALYRQHMAAVGRPKPSSVWDARAGALKHRGMDHGYTSALVQRMDLSGCETLLDVGCGQGNVALALAPRLRAVHGLDYSQGMLDLFKENARQKGLSEAHPILKSWEDDWSDVPECDVVVASRSTAVMDMEDALGKLHAKARRRVYLTSLVGGQFGDVELRAALGRPVPKALPDYIYILNILHAMGVHARVDFIASGVPRAVYQRFEDLLHHVQAREGNLTEQETCHLRRWFESGSAGTSRVATASAATWATWAMVAWDKP